MMEMIKEAVPTETKKIVDILTAKTRNYHRLYVMVSSRFLHIKSSAVDGVKAILEHYEVN